MKIALVGSPNVGKSVIFHHLTGKYVTVSNYPGTTVEVTWGQFKWGEEKVEVVDTPGIYSLFPISGEEKVTRDLLFTEEPDLILHIVDGKNIQRMLPITIQLLEAEFRVILVVNMMDEVRRCGIQLDCNKLSKLIGIPVIPTVSIKKEGILELKRVIGEWILGMESWSNSKILLNYPGEIKLNIQRISGMLRGKYSFSNQSMTLFVLQQDGEMLKVVQKTENQRTYDRINTILEKRMTGDKRSVAYAITMTRQRKAEQILAKCLELHGAKNPYLQRKLSQICTRPLSGIPIVLLVLYFGIYRFVGGFGAGVVVDFLEGVVFRQWLNPLFTTWVERLLPWDSLQLLLVGEYGIFTLGLRYAVAIILPIVGTFFLVFSILEDSGYLPRLALLVDRVLKVIGLNGRAVIPLVLGLGCDTMATLTTRILETKREKVLTTLLLALAIPCSAQLGVISGLLATVPGGLIWWLIVVGTVMLSVGYLAGKFLPGEQGGFYMEVPSLRWPRPGNILSKTRARIEWYFLEILPIFVYSSVLIWIGQLTGLFTRLLSLLEPVVKALGLPAETAVTFLFGFFRRDYGAAGLFDIYHQGILDDGGLIVASITLTLFVPCLAQLAVMIKEYGIKVGLLITGFIFPFAFGIGYLVHLLLSIL